MSFGINDFKPFIDWMQMNPGLSALAVFCISCAESLAIIGLFIPGTVVMPAIGSMIGAGVLPAHWIIIAAILGAILGDNLSYWLGYHYHQHIRNLWPFKHFPKLLANGENFFRRYGGVSVFIGRFAGPVRPIIPVVAGMLNMQPSRFFTANVASAIAWAILYMAPGILLGAISEQLAPHVAARLLIILALITLAVWLCLWIANKIWNQAHRFIERISLRFWIQLVDRSSFVQYFTHLNRTNNPKPLTIFFFIIFFALVLITSTISVLHQGIITFLNWPVFFFCRSIQVPPLDTIMAYAFNITNPITLACICVSVLITLWLQRAWRESFFWLLNLVLVLLLSISIQKLMKISPPDTHTTFYALYSYPSVHLAILVAMIGNFVMLTYYNLIWLRYKKYLILGMLALITCAAAPLLYFGFNWLSDWIASLTCGCLTTWICILFLHRKQTTVEIRPLLFVAFIALFVAVFSISITNTSNFLDQLEKPEFTLNNAFSNWWNKNSLPVPNSRTNFLGNESELLNIQYAGNLQSLATSLEKHGWIVAPKASALVILNRIGAKDRLQQLPLFPDLYQAQKPALIMTKSFPDTNQMLILRLWSSQILLSPKDMPLWIGTLKYHQIWHWRQTPALAITENTASAFQFLTESLPHFQSRQTQIDKPLCHNMICQTEVLKLAYLKTPYFNNNDEDEEDVP